MTACSNMHDEADITIIGYLFQAMDDGHHVVRVLSDDSDIFMLLVYWTWCYDLQDRLAAQMEKWDGVVLEINATCANLGDRVCSQLLGAHAITGCDTVSYPFGKGKASVLKTLKAGDFPGLFDVLGEEGATEENLMAVGQQLFASLYGQPAGPSMTQARYNLYTRKQGKLLRILSLPPTDQNLYLHVRRAHLQMLLWKAPNKQGPPDVSISEYGWELEDGIAFPCIHSDPPGPPLLMNMISCHCQVKGKACKEGNCSCHHEKLAAGIAVSAQLVIRAAIPSQGKRRRKRMMNNMSTNMNMMRIMKIGMRQGTMSWRIDIHDLDPKWTICHPMLYIYYCI